MTLILIFLDASAAYAEKDHVKGAAVLCVAIPDQYLNIRTAPSEDGEIIGRIYRYGTGKVLQSAGNGEWLRIRSGTVSGYVSAEFMAVGEEAVNLMEAAGYKVARALHSQQNIYDTANEDSSVAAVVPEATYLEVLEETDDWTNVRTPYGVTGWIRSGNIKVSVAYSTAETLSAEENRVKQQEQAHEAAARESELWEIAQQALVGTADTKVPLMEAQMELEEAASSYEESGEGDTQAREAYEYALQKVKEAQALADEDQKAAEEKVEEAQRASVVAQASEKVAIEAARRAPRGAAGCDFLTTRDHSLLVEITLGEELVNYASQFVGNPYVWGGESLTDGCDCSGFTMLIYAKYGITLPHFAQSQAAYGELVSEEDLQPGDLVFFRRDNYIYHVAIYIGNHTILHAMGTAYGICFTDLDYSDSEKIYRRLLQPAGTA